MNADTREHSYEELREAIIAVLLGRHENGVDRFERLLVHTALQLARRDESDRELQPPSPGAVAGLHPDDAELALEIVWDLFRQGILTFGLNASNPGWPYLRLTRFGECALQQAPYRLHNKADFMKALRSEGLDLSPNAVLYLREAVAAFYTDCLLSACVMLGVAAETEFLRLLGVAKDSKTYGRFFSRIGDGMGVRAKILRFGEAIKPMAALLPEGTTADLGEALTTMQSILRATRGESGEPSGASPPSRDQVYVYLQLFIPFAEQLSRLRRELTEADYPRLVSAP